MFYIGNGINVVKTCERGDFILLKGSNGYRLAYVQSSEPRGVYLSFIKFRITDISFEDCNNLWSKASPYNKDSHNAHWLNFRDEHDTFTDCIVVSMSKRSNTMTEYTDDTINILNTKQKSVNELLDSICN